MSRPIPTEQADELMPMPKAKQVGNIRLRRHGKSKWRASWWDKEKGQTVARVISATSRDEAIEVAEEINAKLLTKRGYLPTSRGKSGHTIREAFSAMLAARRVRPDTYAHYKRRTNEFTGWLGKRFPGVTQWAELRPHHVQEYVNSLEDAGLAYDSIRNRFVPVRAASIYMSDNYPDLYRHITRKTKLPKRGRRVAIAVPGQGEIEALLTFVGEKRPDILPIVALQSLAGLRIMESLSIREQDIDLDARTVTIAETPIHAPKNESSERTIPICDSLAAILRAAIIERKVIHREGFIFLTRYGRPWRPGGYNHAIKPLLKQCGAAKSLPVFIDMMPRRLRAAFVSLVRDEGADSRVVQAYLGQTPTDVLGLHYEAIPIDRMRREVVARLDGAGIAENTAKRARERASTECSQDVSIDIEELSG